MSADESVRNTAQPMSKEQSLWVTELQRLEIDFRTLCARIGTSRELSLAVTNMEQAGMWAVRHILNKVE